jgi:hypothetical protein
MGAELNFRLFICMGRLLSSSGPSYHNICRLRMVESVSIIGINVLLVDELIALFDVFCAIITNCVVYITIYITDT